MRRILSVSIGWSGAPNFSLLLLASIRLTCSLVSGFFGTARIVSGGCPRRRERDGYWVPPIGTSGRVNSDDWRQSAPVTSRLGLRRGLVRSVIEAGRRIG